MARQKKTMPVVPPQFSGDVVQWAMWLYYVEGETQEGTARRLGMSRASVVNYLNEAKERGLVKITVAPDLLATGKLSEALCTAFGLDQVVILPPTDRDGTDDEDLRKRAGLAGARVLRDLVQEGSVLAVAWGRTVLELARAMERREIADTTVLQVSGSMLDENQSSPEFCTALIANRIGGRSLHFHAPGVLSSKELRDRLLLEPPISRYISRLKHCDVAVFGVGAMDEAPYLGDINLADEDLIAAYRAKGAEGILVGRFIDAQGREIEGPLTDRQIAISMDDLKRPRCRLLVASGQSKTAAIRAALLGGFATHLVIDFQTATRLLQTEQNETDQ